MRNATQIIDHLGGTGAVAALTGVKSPSVSEWKVTGRIPDDKLMRLAPRLHADGFAARWDLFPTDWHLIWPELVGSEGAPVPVEAKAA